MFRKFLFITSLFCLGSMVFPMQVIELSIFQDACCEMTTTNADCCEKTDSTSCHNSEQNSKNSKDDCQDHCQQCHTCHGCFMPIFYAPESNKNSLTNFNTNQKAFAHSDHFFNNSFFNIWQPPKIS
ncbi:hypothetical protein [Chryseobacterium sp. POL2]|uniref:hypothetical protein n=1 Tax=Chryseobacterium sp. POL2 TaxID=2713414 RepID=UPI0013E1B738|nr:hypothetical protein [Chryseobacterium sp. POL2]QIG90149.1 hypothetical protein G6R40_10975 [Chryseobacterium sp. POL2]